MVRRRRRSDECRRKASSPAPLPRGAEVEVRLDSEGFHGSWYEATVADFAPANGRRVCDYYTATYSHLLADDGCTALTEVVPASQVRPRPPPPPSESESSAPPPRFRLYDIVEAFHFDGWWTGIVMSTLDSPDPDPGASASASASVTVGFPITRDFIEFPAHLVRPRRDYVDGHWVPSRAAMAAPSYKLRVYEVGEKVEVGRYRDLYGYSWFPATVLRVVDELSYVVDYGEGKATATGTEYVHWRFIRPALEHFCRDSESELQLVPGNEIEVYCKGAWSLGEVDSVIRGKWKYKVIVGNKKEYMLVTKVVELLKPINNWNNWIGNQRRIVAAKRPSANLRRVSMSGENPRSPVDVTCNGDTDEQHGHDPESPATKKSRKNLKQLDGVLAEGSECSPHCSLVMGIPLSDQNRNDHMCTDHSAAQVAKSNRVMETAIASLDYQVQHAVGKVDQHADGKMDRHADGKLDGSSVLLCLQNAGISQSTMDSSPLRSCSASESMLPSPLALSLSRSPNNCSGNRRRIAVAKRLVNLRTPSMSCENPSSPVDVTSNGDENSHDPESSTTKKFPINSSPLRSCSASESLFPSPLADGKPLFVKSSPMWPQIEAMGVFNVYPQRPHFLPLREFPPAMHEGMALGLTSVLPNLVRIIRKASIDNNMEWFEDKFSTLRHLERHGFSVQSLHSTLTKLVKIKSQQSICLGEMDKLDIEIEVETASLTRMGALLDEKDSAIAELEQKLGALRQETQKIAAEMETKGTKLSRFKSQQSRFKEAYGDAKREFHSVLAALPGSA